MKKNRDPDGLFCRRLFPTPKIGVFFSFRRSQPIPWNRRYEKSHADGRARSYKCMTRVHSTWDIVPGFFKNLFFSYFLILKFLIKESGPASHPPKQVFCPLVIPFGHVQEKRGIEGVRRIEGVPFFFIFFLKYNSLILKFLIKRIGIRTAFSALLFSTPKLGVFFSF